MNRRGSITEERSDSLSSLPHKTLPMYLAEKKSFTPLFITRILIISFFAIGWYSLKILEVANSNNHRISANNENRTVKEIVTFDDRDDAYPGHIPDYPPYNEEEAIEHIFYAKVAFCTEHAITSWSCGDMCERAPIVGTDKVKYIPEGERFQVQGYVAQIPSKSSSIDQDIKCMISFRGSLNVANWYADFLTMLRPWPLNELSGSEWCRGCKAHYGFTEAYDELRASVHEAIEELGCTRMVLTGHSLGAAIATIASFDLRAAMGYQVDATWTYGKPRIGNTEFVTNFVQAATEQGVSPPMWRIVHYHDPVPRAPPHLPGLHPVAHGALEVYYTDRASSEYIVCPQHGAIENQSESCMGGWPLYFPVNMDHVSYINQSFAFKDFPEECKAMES